VVLVLGMGNAQYACGGAADNADCVAEDYDRTTCALPGGQPALVAAVKAALAPGVPLIGVLVHGGAFCLDAATLGAFDGLLDAWYPGMRGGAAMADALVGAFSPAGRSPVTWYASDAALPADRGAMSPYPVPGVSPGITYRFYAPEAASPPLPPPVFTFGEGLSYTTFSVVSVAAAATAAPCDAIPLSVTLANTGAMDSEVVVQVFLAQPSLAGPAPRTRLATFARAFVRAGGRATVALPPVAPSFRARVTNDASGEDIYTLPGKRFADPGQLRFRVCLGEHNCHLQGGYAFNVTQAGPSTDLSTCGK
jgi:beta-glucosidase